MTMTMTTVAAFDITIVKIRDHLCTMKGSTASLQLLKIIVYTLSGCSASSSFSRPRRGGGSVSRTFKSLSLQYWSGRLRPHRDADTRSDILRLVHLRGGQQQQQDDTDEEGSYHGNYIFPKETESPPTAASTSGVVGVETTAVSPPLASSSTSTTSAPPILAIATSTNTKLSNLQERTGPAILMLGASYLLLKYTGKYGLIGLVLVMQCAMYAESTSVVETYYKRKMDETTTNKDIVQEKEELVSFQLQKWWWFATALMITSGRKFLSEYTSITMDQWNLITQGMTSVSLVVAVVQLALISSTKGEELYRQFLGKMTCCHFSLLLLVGMSSFWIKTVEEYGLVWVLFPALLVVVNDTMAYVFGVLLGKHKLLPRLSPKKTVEGFVGAGMSTLVVAAPLLRRMLNTIANNGADDGGGIGAGSRRHALIMALYVSLISPFGGFLASAVKRAHDAKDFGSLIPGHGGVVDRFDCQVVTAPFVYLYLKNCTV